MKIVLLVTAASFSAVCIWLTVRIVNRKERWAKWALSGVLATPLLYIASFGPACWPTSQVYIGGEQIAWNRALIIYIPLARMIHDKPDGRFERFLIWWMTRGTPKGRKAMIPLDATKTAALITIDPADVP